MANILITGGSGMIGKALTNSLLVDGHRVHHLGRTIRNTKGVSTFRWDLVTGYVDPACLEGITHIVHLAGAGIADKRWTKQRVKMLIDSRAESARLLLSTVQQQGHSIQAFVSAAGVNYYGAVTSDRVFVEDDPAGADTIGHISKEWEAAVDEWNTVTRVVKLRTPIVLAKEGALPKLMAPVRFGLGAALGSGKQWMPWVHLSDLVRIYQAAIGNENMTGPYNVNSGGAVRNSEFMKTLSHVLHRPLILPRVPKWMLNLALGELGSLLLEGSRASNEKLRATGAQFHHVDLASALEDLLTKGSRPS